jgi:hypothetical protein
MSLAPQDGCLQACLLNISKWRYVGWKRDHRFTCIYLAAPRHVSIDRPNGQNMKPLSVILDMSVVSLDPHAAQSSVNTWRTWLRIVNRLSADRQLSHGARSGFE